MIWKKKPTLKDLLPPPVTSSHGEYSMILSAHDEKSRPTPALLNLSLAAICAASQIDLSDLSKRLSHPPYYPDIWPGEHYKLLAAFVQVLQPKVAIEIGTATGLSALAMLPFLPNEGKLVTLDLKCWKDVPSTVLRESDFKGTLHQVVGDLSDFNCFSRHGSLLKEAEWIFIDAKHDGHLERRLLDLLSTLPFSSPPWLLFDDIRVWSMLKMWREISYPKIDLTSFGHWSGTGIVQIA